MTTAIYPVITVIHGECVRATVPAIEALLAAGNRVAAGGVQVWPGNAMRAAQVAADIGWTVWLTRVPEGLRPVAINQHAPNIDDVALRLDSEPAYPRESRLFDAWQEAQWTIGCPAKGCGRALLWAEAGYVPGWRVCAGGGHFASLDRLAGVGSVIATPKGRVPVKSVYYIDAIGFCSHDCPDGETCHHRILSRRWGG